MPHTYLWVHGHPPPVLCWRLMLPSTWVMSPIKKSCHTHVTHICISAWAPRTNCVIIYEWVISRIWMSRVTYEWVMSYTCHPYMHDFMGAQYRSCVDIWMSHVTYMNESCHIWMSHVTHMSHIYARVHGCPALILCWHVNESCHIYEWVVSIPWVPRNGGCSVLQCVAVWCSVL